MRYAAEDVIARLIPPRLTASAQSADPVADQASGPAHPALWAPLAQQPPLCLTQTPSSPLLSLTNDKSYFVPEPAVSFRISILGDVGNLGATTLSQRPSLRPSSKTANRGMQVNATVTSQQVAQRSKLSAAGRPQVPVTLPAAGSLTQSVSMMHSNIVPLQSRAQHNHGSKGVYNSLFDRSSRRSPPVPQLDSRQASSACNSRVQEQPEVSSSTDDVDSDLQQQQNSPSAPTGAGLWTRTTQLARLVSFPVRVTRAYYSYVPLGQQLYLNPQSVTTSMQTPKPAVAPHVGVDERSSTAAASTSQQAALSPTTAAATLSLAARAVQREPATALLSDALGEVVDSVVLQRKDQLGRLWMHRMPTYRARFQQIFFSALGQALPLSVPAPRQTVWDRQGKSIAPEIHVRRAEACAGSLLASHHLKDMLQVSSFVLL